MGEEYVLVNVEYPWKPPTCSICQCFGHKTTKCAKAPAKVWKERTTRKYDNAQTNDNGAGPSGTMEVITGLELAIVPTVEEVLPILIGGSRNSPLKETGVITTNKFSSLYFIEEEGEVADNAMDKEEAEIDVVMESPSTQALVVVTEQVEDVIVEPNVAAEIQQYE
ncbi:hypothetical protein FRX31_024570 [Thalictrum thalictroides]|uniref:Uncharacterized protein n=1 Tax=Thalictrum thalictroides TaxID=46969 RepID=A0A7J6VNV7_THATH|nr:hypothetical protein FRX31_024570 [Thalictrum thalictroides]